jgi:tripartite-type tricarboxylate transporter receptor subunit TctC
MTLSFRKFATSVAIAASMATMALPVSAQTYPFETVVLTTHSSPGGGTDVFLREMTRYLGKYLGTNFVVENVRGGSGAKAMADIATAPADGARFYGTTPTYINTSLLSLPEFTFRDMSAVANVFLDPQIVFVRKASPFQNLAEIVEASKVSDTAVKFGVTTPGSLDRQVMEQFKAITGAQGPVVTHDGGGELLISVLNGTVDLGIGEIQELAAQIEAGEIRVITTYTKERLSNLPDVPTATEQGIDLVVNKFRGIAGPKNLPDEIYAAWETAIQAVLQDPEFKEWYEAQSLVPAYMGHVEYDAFLADFATEQEAFLKQYGIIQ